MCIHWCLRRLYLRSETSNVSMKSLTIYLKFWALPRSKEYYSTGFVKCSYFLFKKQPHSSMVRAKAEVVYALITPNKLKLYWRQQKYVNFLLQILSHNKRLCSYAGLKFWESLLHEGNITAFSFLDRCVLLLFICIFLTWICIWALSKFSAYLLI